MEDEEATEYTFKQPVRGGYYYIVVKASSLEEAAQVIADIVDSIMHRTGRLEVLSYFPEGALVIDSRMRARLDEVGHAHRFVQTPLPPFSERKGYEARLPE